MVFCLLKLINMAPTTRRGARITVNTRATRNNRRVNAYNRAIRANSSPPSTPPPAIVQTNPIHLNTTQLPVSSQSGNSKINGISLLTAFFDGEPDECHHFFSQFQNIAELSGWTDAEKLTILKTRLRGNALSFLLHDKELSESNDYNLVTKKIIDFFSEETGISDHQTKYSTCQQWEGETIKNFAYRVTLLTNNYLGTNGGTQNNETKELIDRLKLSKFVDALLPEIRLDVLKANPQNFESAVKAATNSQSANDTLKKMQSMQLNMIKNTETEEIKCIFCGLKNDHYSKNCEVFKVFQNPPTPNIQSSEYSRGYHHNNNRGNISNRRGNFNYNRRGSFNSNGQNRQNFSQGNNYNQRDFNRRGNHNNRGQIFRGRYSRNFNNLTNQNNHFLGKTSGTQI